MVRQQNIDLCRENSNLKSRCAVSVVPPPPVARFVPQLAPIPEDALAEAGECVWLCELESLLLELREALEQAALSSQ